MKIANRQIASLDIGSSRIRIAVAEVNDETKELRIKGYGEVKSRGITKGLITDIDEATKAIKEAKKIAEEKSGLIINKCYIGITGDHIRGIASSDKIQISKLNSQGLREPRKIVQNDVDKLIEHINGIKLSSEREILFHLSLMYYMPKLKIEVHIFLLKSRLFPNTWSSCSQQ